MASRISEARQDFLALQADLNKGLDAKVRIAGLDEALAKVGELRRGLEGLPPVGGARASSSSPAFSSATDADFKRSRWETPPVGGSRAATQQVGAMRAAGAGAAKAAGVAGKDIKSAFDSAMSGSLPGGTKYLLKQAGVGKAALRAPVVALAFNTSKLALGQAGLARLHALGQRTHQQVQGLFKGVDSSPVTRAADRLSQIFSPATASGKALAGLMGRVFNGFFAAVEKVEPYVSVLFRSMVAGAQMVEIGYLRMRVALLPITDSIGASIGETNGLRAAAEGVVSVFETLGNVVDKVAAGVAFVTQGLARKGLLGTKPQDAEYKRIAGEEAAARGESASRASGKSQIFTSTDGGAFQRNEGAEVAADIERRAAAGRVTGKAYADGMVAGVGAGIPAVGAAGQALAGALDQGVRDKGKIHSPSKLAEETGSEFPAGYRRGVESGVPDVQAAGAKLVPNMAGGAGGGARGGSAPASLSVSITHLWQGERPKDARAYEQAAEAGDRRALRSIAQQLGVSLELVTT